MAWSVWDGRCPVIRDLGASRSSRQSGLLSLRMAAFIAETGQGIDLWVTLGNCADVNPDEMIEYLGQRAETSVIVVYLEKIEDPERLRRSIASARANGTDVVLLKSGRSALGSLTAASHTGALAAPDTFVDVLAEEADAIRVDTIREAAQVASVIAAAGKRPIGPFLVTSASGGDCVLAADWCTKFDVPLAQLSQDTLQRVHELVPEAAWGNPLDLTPVPIRGRTSDGSSCGDGRGSRRGRARAHGWLRHSECHRRGQGRVLRAVRNIRGRRQRTKDPAHAISR